MIRKLKALFSAAKPPRPSEWSHPEKLLEFDIESLESRKMLAGDISVNVAGDNLTLTGDAEDNQVEVYEDGGTVWVSALDDTSLSGDATTDDFDTGIAAGTLNNLKVNMKGGDDWVDLGYSEILGDVITGLEIAGKLSVKTGGGDDIVWIQATVGGKTVVKTGAGDDELLLEEAGFAGPVKANLGAGEDYVEVISAHSDGKVSVKLGGGDDYVYVDTTGLTSGTTILPIINGGGGFDDIDTDITDDVELIAASGLVRLKGFEA